jgi:hypothetical protein
MNMKECLFRASGFVFFAKFAIASSCCERATPGTLRALDLGDAGKRPDR